MKVTANVAQSQHSPQNVSTMKNTSKNTQGVYITISDYDHWTNPKTHEEFSEASNGHSYDKMETNLKENSGIDAVSVSSLLIDQPSLEISGQGLPPGPQKVVSGSFAGVKRAD